MRCGLNSNAGRAHPALFLSVTGGGIAPDVMSRLVSAYIQGAVPAKKGSCHLFRHTAATLMLDAGADVRHIAEILWSPEVGDDHDLHPSLDPAL